LNLLQFVNIFFGGSIEDLVAVHQLAKNLSGSCCSSVDEGEPFPDVAKCLDVEADCIESNVNVWLE
jgi:hypothetical protein